MLYPLRNHIVNGHGAQRLSKAVELTIDFPLIEQRAARHEPYLPFRMMQQRNAVKQQPGERFVFAYPAVCAFFASIVSLLQVG